MTTKTEMSANQPDDDEFPEIEEAPIPGYEGHYTITTDGQVFCVKAGKHSPVRTFAKYKFTNNVSDPDSPLFKSGQPDEVNLSRGHVKRFRVFELATLAFIGHKPTPIHRAEPKDGNWYNFDKNNLQWVTGFQRQLHSKASRAERLAAEYHRREAIAQAQAFILKYNQHPEIQNLKAQLYPNQDKLQPEELTAFIIELGKRGLL